MHRGFLYNFYTSLMRNKYIQIHPTHLLVPAQSKSTCVYAYLYPTEALKGHRVVWKIEIYYLIRMT